MSPAGLPPFLRLPRGGPPLGFPPGGGPPRSPRFGGPPPRSPFRPGGPLFRGGRPPFPFRPGMPPPRGASPPPGLVRKASLERSSFFEKIGPRRGTLTESPSPLTPLDEELGYQTPPGPQTPPLVPRGLVNSTPPYNHGLEDQQPDLDQWPQQPQAPHRGGYESPTTITEAPNLAASSSTGLEIGPSTNLLENTDSYLDQRHLSTTSENSPPSLQLHNDIIAAEQSWVKENTELKIINCDRQFHYLNRFFFDWRTKMLKL